MDQAKQDIALRFAAPEDAEAIGRIRVAAWQAAYQAFMPQDFLQNLDPSANLDGLRAALPAKEASFSVLVLDVDGRCEGFAIVGKPRYPTEADTLELWALNIAPACWGHGLAQALVGAAVAHARELNFQALALWCIAENIRARKLYERYGFTLTSQERCTDALTGTPLHEVAYVLPMFGQRAKTNSTDH